MVSKCANPACSEKFMRLHEGRIFHLSPTPEAAATGSFAAALHERFWLCDRCCKKMTLVWGGSEVKLVPVPKKAVALCAMPSEAAKQPKTRRHAPGLRQRH